MTLGEKIIQFREEHGYSQRQFAIRCSLSNAYIAMLEKGKNPTTGKPIVPNLDTMKAISDAMGIELGELMAQIDDMLVEINPPTLTLSKDEKELIKKFRQLDERGQAAILNAINFEHKYLNK